MHTDCKKVTLCQQRNKPSLCICLLTGVTRLQFILSTAQEPSIHVLHTHCRQKLRIGKKFLPFITVLLLFWFTKMSKPFFMSIKLSNHFHFSPHAFKSLLISFSFNSIQNCCKLCSITRHGFQRKIWHTNPDQTKLTFNKRVKSFSRS